MVDRVYVAKKPGLAPEETSLLADCRAFLGLTGLERIRIWNRYDAENIDAALFDYARRTVFSEPQLDESPTGRHLTVPRRCLPWSRCRDSLTSGRIRRPSASRCSAGGSAP